MLFKGTNPDFPSGVPDNITLVPLPPYSPELNPVERIWAPPQMHDRVGHFWSPPGLECAALLSSHTNNRRIKLDRSRVPHVSDLSGASLAAALMRPAINRQLATAGHISAGVILGLRRPPPFG